MESDHSTFDAGLIGSDAVKLLVRFVGILVVSPIVGWTVARAWVPGHAIYDAAAGLLSGVSGGGVSPARSLQFVGSAGLGLYFGFLTLFVVDVKKRVQGALLVVGTVLGLSTLAVRGVLLPNIDPGWLPNYFALGSFFFGGVVLSADELRRLSPDKSTVTEPRTEGEALLEFDAAAGRLFTLLAVVIVGSVLQVVVAGDAHPVDFPAAVAALALLYSFVQYEVASNYMLLGPSASGKSMAMLGMVLTTYEFTDVQPDPNPVLQRAIEVANDPRVADWPIEQTEELAATGFQVLVGELFPRRLRLVAHDYPGQLLPRIADRVERVADSSPPDALPILGGRAAGGESGFDPEGLNPDGGTPVDESDVVDAVAADVVAADTLIVVIDCERLVHPQKFPRRVGRSDADVSLGIPHYERIAEAAGADRTIVVATKADVLVHNESVPVDPPERVGGFDAFRRQVREILGDRHDVELLRQQLDGSEIHPVFYKTKRMGTEYVPIRDESNNLVPVGYDELIDVIRGAD